MIKTYNGIAEIIESKSKEQLIEMWNECELRRVSVRMITGEQRKIEFDALNKVQEILMQIMKSKMTESEFVKVVKF